MSYHNMNALHAEIANALMRARANIRAESLEHPCLRRMVDEGDKLGVHFDNTALLVCEHLFEHYAEALQEIERLKLYIEHDTKPLNATMVYKIAKADLDFTQKKA